ncbi:MAG: hypothetical protein WAP03_22965 [Methylorubrum rhodinum]|uniref:hypothetical protein n=1 Tax=Methylorubrum rhodinum TaxID=29428 RepID=UPI003BB1BB54
MPSYRTRGAVDLTGFNAGIDSIAKAFAPPSAHEILYGAQAQKIRDEQSRIAEYYALARDPNADPTVFDRTGVALNLYAPNQSMEAVSRNNVAAGQRNAADNARAMQQTMLQQRGETERALLTPVGKEYTRFVPPTIASAYDLPRTQVGVVEVGQGQQATLPDGRVIAGAPKPESFDEFRAREAAGLTPELRRALAFGNTPTTNIQTTGGPKVMTMLDALGQTPAPDQEKTRLANYRTPDNREGGAKYVEGKGWVDAQTGAVLPQGTKTYTAALQGGTEETGLGKPTVNDIEAQLLDAANLERTVGQLRDLAKRDPGAIGTTGRIQGFTQDAGATLGEAVRLLAPQTQQLVKDAERGLLPADVAQNFNPNIPEARLLENLLVAQLAKLNDPNGRLSNQQMEEIRKGIGAGGMFASSQNTLAVLDAIQRQIEGRRSMLRGISPEAAALGGANRPATPVPAPQQQQPGAPAARRRFNPATGQIE